MGDVQMLFPMEPKEFWQKLKAIVEQVVIEHGNAVPIPNELDRSNQRPLLKVKEVCSILKVSKPTLYEWMKQGRLESVKIHTRRYFKSEDIEKLIESSRSKFLNHSQ
jgi:excisionase family DNA binding protein